MRKVYRKPHIAFESFELSQNIAAGCEDIAHATKGICGIDTGFGILFNTGVVADCEMGPQPGWGDDVCYDVPSDNKNVFSS